MYLWTCPQRTKVSLVDTIETYLVNKRLVREEKDSDKMKHVHVLITKKYLSSQEIS